MEESASFPILLSLRVATIAMAIVGPAAVALALLQARARYRLRWLVDAIVLLPLVLPPSVVGYVLVVALGRRGPLGRALEALFDVRLVFAPAAAVIASGVVALPIVVKTAQPALEAVPSELEAVARSLGLRPVAVFFRVTLPCAWRGVLAAAVLGFARALGEFGATLMVAGNIPGRTDTMPIAIFTAYQSGDDRRAALYVGVLTALSFGVVLVAARLSRVAPGSSRWGRAPPEPACLAGGLEGAARHREGSGSPEPSVSTPALSASLAVRVGDDARAFSLSVDLELARGVLVLFGPSGVGKTLTLSALAGLVAGDRERVRGRASVAGVVLLDSDRGVDVPAHARGVGYVPQQHALFPFLDVAGNVGFGLPRAERRGPRVHAVLDELGLGALASARVDGLSGGERQRVALARALVVRPRLLLLDEPFASLDDDAKHTLHRVVRAAIDRRGIPAVLVTHDAAEATLLGDWLVRFSRGRTEGAGPPRAMLAEARVTIAGAIATTTRSPDGARATARLDGATIEGPARLIEGEVGAPLQLDLPTVPRG